MGNMKIRVAVSVKGPLADGTAHQAVRQWLDASKKAVADEAERQLRAVRLDKTGRGTGHYQSMVTTMVLNFNDMLVHDPVVYGPWLEGTSKRNESTRFKGYHLWRRGRQQAAKQAPVIAQRKLPEYLERIGGQSV